MYVIIEDEYYPESPSYRVLGVVDSEAKAKAICNELKESVEQYNKSQKLYEVGYGYEEFEIGDVDMIHEVIKNNRDMRKF